jgi:hypothetical protein
VALQTGLAGMQVQAWQNNAWQKEANPAAAAAPAPVEGAPSTDPTGIQVGLTATGLAGPMVKSFLLGGT